MAKLFGTVPLNTTTPVYPPIAPSPVDAKPENPPPAAPGALAKLFGYGAPVSAPEPAKVAAIVPALTPAPLKPAPLVTKVEDKLEVKLLQVDARPVEVGRVAKLFGYGTSASASEPVEVSPLTKAPPKTFPIPKVNQAPVVATTATFDVKPVQPKTNPAETGQASAPSAGRMAKLFGYDTATPLKVDINSATVETGESFLNKSASPDRSRARDRAQRYLNGDRLSTSTTSTVSSFRSRRIDSFVCSNWLRAKELH